MVYADNESRVGNGRFRVWALCGCLALLGTRARANDLLDVVGVPLRPELLQGVDVAEGVWKLQDEAIVQSDPDYFVIEASDCSDIRFQPYVGVLKAGRTVDASQVVQEYARELYEYGPQESDEASAGSYIDYTDFARYLFTVTEPGEYTVWVRHWMNWSGYWRYFHRLDGQASAPINMPASEYKPQEWWWKKAQTVTLSKGTHVYDITHLHGGKRLDKIVFHRDPDWVPEGLGPAQQPKQPIESGWVEFETLEPAALKIWAGLETERRLNNGSIAFHVSADGGGTWQALPADNSLPAEYRTAAALRFRAQLQREPGSPSPQLLGARAFFAVNPNPFATLETASYRLVFDRTTGTPVRMVNLETGAQLIDPYLPQKDVLSLFIKRPGEEGRHLKLSAGILAEFLHEGARVVSRYDFLDGAIKVHCTVNADEGMESRWRVNVENNSSYDVLHVQYPYLKRIALDGDSQDDVLMFPKYGGMLHRNPASRAGMSGGYPAGLGMGYVNLFDETGGLSIAQDNDFFVSSRLTVEPNPCAQAVGMGWEMRHRIKAHGGSQTYGFRMGIHPGDWKVAARLYRNTFYGRFGKPDYPDWMVESDGWVYGQVGMGTGHEQKSYDEVRSAAWMGALEFGNDYTQIWGATFSGGCPTYYLPRKECGGAELFTQRNREFREAGGNIGYYFHGNAVSGSYMLTDTYFQTPWDDYPEEVRPPDWDWYVRNRHYGSEAQRDRVQKEPYLQRINRWLKRDTHPTHSGLDCYAYMSYHSGEFFKWLAEWTDRYVLDYRANVIYYDTMAWGADREEYSPFGDFHGEGDGAMYKIDFLTENNTRLRQREPEFAQLTEGTTDIWSLYCPSLLSGFVGRHGLPDIMRYTFPEMIFFDGNANGAWGEKTHKDSLARAWVMGNKFDVIVRSDWSERLFALRQLVSPLLARARFESQEGLLLSAGGIQARGHLTAAPESNAMVITLWNQALVGDAVLRIDTRHYGAFPRYYWMGTGMDPQPVEPVVDGQYAQFDVPAVECAALVGVDEVAASRAVAVSLRYDGYHAVARVMNYSGDALSTDFQVEAENVEFENTHQRVALQPGYNRVSFRPLNADALNVRQILKLDVGSAGWNRRYLTWVGPIIDDGAFSYYKNFNATDEVSRVGGTSVRGGAHRDFISWPHHRYRVSVATRGDGRPYMHFGWQSDQPGRINLTRAGEDEGWTLWETEFDGRGRGRLMVRPHGDESLFVDAMRAIVIPRASPVTE